MRVIICLALLALIVTACGSDEGNDQLYVYPDGKITDQPPGTAGADLGPETIFGGEKDQSASPDSVADVVTDHAGQADSVPGYDLPHYDLHEVLDIPDVDFAEVVNDLQLPEPDLPPVEDGHFFPEVTDDCGPLGLPTKWEGSFEGEITSNIPDMMGYTFNGPCEGKVSFEIMCINQKYVVLGELDGGATNCALPSGCPFTAKMSGMYNPQTQHMEGAMTNVSIDYAAVIVHAEGVFDGDLLGGDELQGNWSGEKTEVENLLLPGIQLDWVDASGARIWMASPVVE